MKDRPKNLSDYKKLKSKPASKIKLVNILEKYDNVAILLGNGFNYAFYDRSTSWAKLVADIWNESHPNADITEDLVKRTNLSLTETAEMSEKPFDNICESVAKFFSNEFIQNSDAKKFLEYLEQRNIPIITTNYDKNIAQELNLTQHYTTRREDAEILPPRFQWGRYYAKESFNKEDILNKFAIWNAHGTIDAPKSLCFTLSDYLECSKEAYAALEGIYSYFYIPSKDRTPHYVDTWLNILFNKNICIIGLSLNENEIFLRLLLMWRMQYMKSHYGNPNKYKGWYLYVNDQDMPFNKKFFLDSVNIKPIKCKNHDAIYKSF